MCVDWNVFVIEADSQLNSCEPRHQSWRIRCNNVEWRSLSACELKQQRNQLASRFEKSARRKSVTLAGRGQIWGNLRRQQQAGDAEFRYDSSSILPGDKRGLVTINEAFFKRAADVGAECKSLFRWHYVLNEKGCVNWPSVCGGGNWTFFRDNYLSLSVEK